MNENVARDVPDKNPDGPLGLQGWICPRCGRGMSPYVVRCECHHSTYLPYCPTIPPYPQPYFYPTICKAAQGGM